MGRLRILAPGDEPELEAFLAGRADSSMFLRSNARAGGLLDRGRPYQGTYAAAFEGGRMVAVAAHYWNGRMVLQAPVLAAAVALRAITASRREMSGLIGPLEQVTGARRALGLAGEPTRLDLREHLFALATDELVLPEPLAAARLTWRRPRPDELEGLCEWRVAYCIETMGLEDGPRLRAACHAKMEALEEEGAHWVLEDGGQTVAYSAFNARLPDAVQVGGVYTPPALRGRGYARCVVAGSLVDARAEGARRAVLFTGVDNQPAQRAYRALGFAVVGGYGQVEFADGQEPRAPLGLLADGRAAFNQGAYFEAHEAWEEAWIAASEPARGWLQGLIQVAAAFHKLRGGSPAAAARTLRRGLARLAHAPEEWGGLDIAGARRGGEAVLTAVVAGQAANTSDVRV